MDFKKIIIFLLILIPSVSHGASSLFSATALNNSYTPTVIIGGSPTTATVTNFSDYSEIRFDANVSGTEYAGFRFDYFPGNLPGVTDVTIEYSFIENVAGTCTMALKNNTGNISGGTLSLPATVATTTHTFTGMGTNFTGNGTQVPSITLGMNASCNGTLRILSVTTNVSTVNPLLFTTQTSPVNTIYVPIDPMLTSLECITGTPTSTCAFEYSTTTASSTAYNYTGYFGLTVATLIIFLFIVVILFARYSSKQYL